MIVNAGPDGLNPIEPVAGMELAEVKGVRGASLCRATDFGRRFRAYFDAHNGEVLVVVMLEHVDAVRNADAILNTRGIDAPLIGPYDLSTSMGRSGQFDDSDVRRAKENRFPGGQSRLVQKRPGKREHMPETKDQSLKKNRSYGVTVNVDGPSVEDGGRPDC